MAPLQTFARIAVTVAVMLPRAALAYRPFDGTDADVAELDTIELEIGPLQAGRAHDDTFYTPTFVFNAGIAEGYELVVDVDGSFPRGLTDAHAAVASDVLVKHVLREGSLQTGRGPSVAIEAGVLLPSIPADGVDEAGGSVSLIASQRFGAWTIHLNVFGAYERQRQLAGFASAIVEGPADWRVRPVAELLVADGQGEDRIASVLGGVIWQRSRTFSFDAAVRAQRGDNAVEVRAGLTWTFSD